MIIFALGKDHTPINLLVQLILLVENIKVVYAFAAHPFLIVCCITIGFIPVGVQNKSQMAIKLLEWNFLSARMI